VLKVKLRLADRLGSNNVPLHMSLHGIRDTNLYLMSVQAAHLIVKMPWGFLIIRHRET
jgi:hypothetical protein